MSSNNDTRVHVYVQPWENLQTRNKRVLAIDHMITINECILYTVQCTYTSVMYSIWFYLTVYKYLHNKRILTGYRGAHTRIWVL